MKTMIYQTNYLPQNQMNQENLLMTLIMFKLNKLMNDFSIYIKIKINFWNSDQYIIILNFIKTYIITKMQWIASLDKFAATYKPKL